MKKIFYILPIFFGLLINASAQETVMLEWGKRMGSTGSDAGQDIVLDGAGNIYTTGSFSATVDFDPGAGTFNLTSAGSNDIFISKLDANGNFVWARSMGGVGSDGGSGIAVDLSGNVYITGGFQGTADFDPGPGTFMMTAATTGQTDIYILKLDANGNFGWAKGIIGGTWWDNGLKIVLDGAANVHVIGRFYYQGGTRDFDPGPGTFFLTAGQEDAFILKLDTNGNFIWAKNFGGGFFENRGYSIVLDAVGNIYSTGYFEGTIDFDPGAGTFNLTASGDWDVFYSKLDANGNFVWARAMVNSNPNYYTDGTYGRKISLDGAGNLYATSRFNGTVDFDPGVGIFNLTSLGGFDIYITKLTTDGDFVWAKSMGGSGYDEGMTIANDASGDVYITGYYAQSVDFDPSAGVFNRTSAGSNDIFVCKFDSNGNFKWAGSMGGINDDRGIGLNLDAAGNIYMVGWFQGTSDFDPRPCIYNLTSAGSNDIFILKLSQTTLTPLSISSITPDNGPEGSSVIITGTGFSATPVNNTVTFFSNKSGIVTASTATSITTTVPTGATTGTVAVIVDCINVNSVSNFTVTAPLLPTITSFNPASGPVGTTVIITGTNFSATPANNTVQFNGTTATVTASTAISITVTVPSGAISGKITVTVAGNTATSTNDFTVTAPTQTITITAQPVNFPACPKDVATFTTTATGTTNITYQWQIKFDGIFTNITNGVGYAGVNTAMFTINTSQNNGVGIFRCLIGGDAASSVFTNEVSITLKSNCQIQPINQPPVIVSRASAAPINGIVTIDLLRLISDPDDNVDLSTLSLNGNISEQGATASITSAFVLVLDYGGVAFAGADHVSLSVCDLLGACDEQELSIEVSSDVIVYNAVSPNNDGLNDIFYIQYINLLPETQENKVNIFNRWGSKVFEVVDYNNDTNVFKGLNQNGAELPSGTYYYKIEFGNGQAAKTGYLVLKR